MFFLNEIAFFFVFWNDKNPLVSIGWMVSDGLVNLFDEPHSKDLIPSTVVIACAILMARNKINTKWIERERRVKTVRIWSDKCYEFNLPQRKPTEDPSRFISELCLHKNILAE